MKTAKQAVKRRARKSAGTAAADNTPQVFEPKRNSMFTEDQRELVRFLRYPAAVPCAECGRRSRHHWTQRVPFEAKTVSTLILTGSGKIHPAGTPVCRDHPLITRIPSTPAQTALGVKAIRWLRARYGETDYDLDSARQLWLSATNARREFLTTEWFVLWSRWVYLFAARHYPRKAP